MNKIIVTVQDVNQTYSYDMELATNQMVGDCLMDMVESLTKYNNHIRFDGDTVSLFCNRLGKYLDTDISIIEAGVWNGDYLTIVEG